MAITLPFPVRVAAGLIATGIDVVRSLPEDIPAIPVTLVGNALKLSMKVQQEIATLATRGDELLGGVIGPPQETPSWARFDDEPAAPTPAATGKPRLKSAPTGDQVDEAGDATTAGSSKPTAGATSPDPAAGELTTPTESSVAPITTIAMDAALEVPEAVLDVAIGIEPAESVHKPAATAAEPSAALNSESSDGPAGLPGYDRMTLAQVRGHLRELTPDKVSALLRYEQDGNNRAPFLTLLSNRLVTLDAQNS